MIYVWLPSPLCIMHQEFQGCLSFVLTRSHYHILNPLEPIQWIKDARTLCTSVFYPGISSFGSTVQESLNSFFTNVAYAKGGVRRPIRGYYRPPYSGKWSVILASAWKLLTYKVHHECCGFQRFHYFKANRFKDLTFWKFLNTLKMYSILVARAVLESLPLLGSPVSSPYK